MDHLADAVPIADSEEEDHAFVNFTPGDDDETIPTLPNDSPTHTLDPVAGQSKPQHFNIRGGGEPVTGRTRSNGKRRWYWCW